MSPVQFDHRGDPIWQAGGNPFDHPGLSLNEEEGCIGRGKLHVNVKGGRLGYNPYESGLVKKKEQDRARKKDLRALSKWIKMEKKLPNKC